MKVKSSATEEVIQKLQEGLEVISKSEFKNCVKRLEKVVVVNGEYFVGDKNLV